MTSLTVMCVLRSGGDYHPWHVAWLHSQVARHLPGARFVCLSDIPVTCERLSLLHDWPGWWSKMEIYRPDIEGDILYFDLDVAVIGDLTPIASAGSTTLLSDGGHPDFIAKNTINSSVMFLSASDRARVWKSWIADPAAHMARCGAQGDQMLIGEVLHASLRWQDVLPGAMLSYKIDVRPHGGVPPAECRVVYFHGRPRPWRVEVDWLPRAARADWTEFDAGLVDSVAVSARENDRLHTTIEGLRRENLELRTKIDNLSRFASR
jgi:hypothetical protein